MDISSPFVTAAEEAASSTSLITRGAISFSYLLESGRPGPSVLILGSVHGHEPCGASAIARMLQEFSRGELKLESGSLTLVIGNPEALARGVRGVDDNLNRLFRDNLDCKPNSIEHRRVRELRPLFDGKSHVLDLHATSAPTEPFLMCERKVLTTALPWAGHPIVMGWIALGDSSISGDTESFATRRGATAYTMECGQRDDAASHEVAYSVSRRFLSYLGMLAPQSQVPLLGGGALILELFAVETKHADDFEYSREHCNFDPLAAGELIARDGTREYRAPRACRIVMPTTPSIAKVGEDMYLLADEVEG